MLSCFRNKRDKTIKRKKFFMVNGAAVLEKIINGDCNPIRSFSAEELNKATSHFQWLIDIEPHFGIYGGTHQDREIAVKRFVFLDDVAKADGLGKTANEIATASMSNHKNVLKLLGCCLETELPILVYEFPRKGSLASYIYNNDQHYLLLWEQKLRIVIEIVNAIAYLHHGLSKTVVHRQIKPPNIFLDENSSAKLFEFRDAVPIPEGESHVKCFVVGTRGFVAPEVLANGRYTENSDVYGFWVLLCQVLTQKGIIDLVSWHREFSYKSVSDSRVELDGFGGEIVAEYCKNYLQGESNKDQIMEYAKFVQRCLEDNPDDFAVEKSLRLIKTI